MRVSVIVTTYKDLTSLEATLESLLRQDYDNFEVVIAEDDDSSDTILFLKKYERLEIVHVSHPDSGRKKTAIQNRAISKSSGEYLIFLDGDVIVYKSFISAQVKIAKKGQILAGRRVNLNESISAKIKSKQLNPQKIEQYYLLYALLFMFDRESRFEQGIYLSPDSFIYKYFLSKRERAVSILGCNWSCFKEDFVKINGFDAGYTNSSIGEDTDLDWRFKMAGYSVKSSKNIANLFHLYHKKSDILSGGDGREQMKVKRENRLFICKEGISKL